MYELSSEDVVQICTALQSCIQVRRQMKELLAEVSKKRNLTVDEVHAYDKCDNEVAEMQQVYNKFRSN